MSNIAKKEEKKQKQWDSLTSAERRVALAKDVIKNIHAAKLKFKFNRGYITGSSSSLINVPNDQPLTSKEVEEIKKNCSVCARGALLISRVDKFNKLTKIDLGFGRSSEHSYDSNRSFNTSQENTTDGLAGAFTENQLDLIEEAFEAPASWSFSLPDTTAEKFGYQFDDPNDRMLAIMQNIVDHDGTFKPSVHYVVS